MAKCTREGCNEEVIATGWYCSNLCAAIDVESPVPFTPTQTDINDLRTAFAEDEEDPRSGQDPHVLPTDSEERKGIPVFSGVLNYFPLAIAAVARHSKIGNDKHNPGEPLHWARGKSRDHADCIARHLIDHLTVDPKSGEYLEARALAWRSLALLQELEEKRLGKPYSRGSR